MKTYSCYRQTCEAVPEYRLRFEGKTACVCSHHVAGVLPDLLDCYRSVNVTRIVAKATT